MRTNFWRVAFVTAILSLTLPGVKAQEYYEVNTVPNTRTNAYRQGEVIVKFNSDGPVKVRRNAKGLYQSSSVSEVDNVMQQIGVTDIEPLMPLTGELPPSQRRKVRSFNGTEFQLHDLSKLYCLKTEGNMGVEEVVNKLKELPEVEFAEPNYFVYACASSQPNDPLFSQQWGVTAINADKLWDIPAITDKRPVIAILDTGVDIEHPDLVANIWTNTAEAEGSEGYDDDGNGFADDIHGWDFIDNCAQISDYNGHGTHCAGIAAAVGNNGIGICGANPDALIMPIIVMQSDGTGDTATIVKGIDYAVANGADVLSMSFGTYSYALALDQALGRAYMKSVLVAAAGNDKNCIYPFHHQQGPGPMFPAAFTFVFGVQASTHDGNLSGFSNWDCDGPIYFDPGCYSEEQMYNYELKAPGTNIISTYPRGQYKSWNGTSMACPLVAGAISKYLQIKEMPNGTKDQFYADMVHSTDEKGVVDIFKAYNIKDGDRKPNLSVVSWRIEDETDNDGRFDAGEIINFYPILRNEWGQAKNIKIWIEHAELEKDVIEVLSDKVDFDKPLSSYAKAETATPFRFRVKDNVADGRHCKIVLYIQCDGMEEPSAREIVFIAENGVEIGGMIDRDMILEPGFNYILSKTLLIPKGVKFVIKPGVNIKFKNNCGIVSNGDMVVKGSSKEPIRFYATDDFCNTFIHISNMEYVILEGLTFSYGDVSQLQGSLSHSMIKYCTFYSWMSTAAFDRCLIYKNEYNLNSAFIRNCERSAIIGNHIFGVGDGYVNLNGSVESCDDVLFEKANNIIGNSYEFEYPITLGPLNEMKVYKTSTPSYFGSARENIIRSAVYDSYKNAGLGMYDFTNALIQPNPDTQGLVWKVVVDGYDAQDEFDMLPPLGVGRHKFEVWYSKVIDTSFTPTIAMGVRPPYNATSIAEDGSWRTEITKFNNNGEITDVPVSVYTSYIDIKGSMAIDGLNRIYVEGAQDLEYFDIPLENTRFQVEVAAAGSMSTGFFATPGIGKVDLEWEDLDMNIEDIMGYNLYRMVERETTEWDYDEDWNWVEKPITVTDTIRINQRLIEQPKYTDFDVVPGQRYDYYYKVMRTDMAETSPSKVVSVVPLTASKGDANGSLTVDVADVVTEISYMTGGNPEPFIFEAADVNSDEEINILDVVGTINIIVNPNSASTMTEGGLVKYWITDGILYMENDVPVAGAQFLFNNVEGVHALEALEGFETVNQNFDNQVIFMAYSMVGRTLTPGIYALVAIDGYEVGVESAVCSDIKGHNVVTMQADMAGMSVIEIAQMRLPNPNPFVDMVNIPFVIGDNENHCVEIRFCDLTGRMLDSHKANYGYGEYSYTWRPSVQSGIYLASLYIDGALVQTAKLIKK